MMQTLAIALASGVAAAVIATFIVGLYLVSFYVHASCYVVNTSLFKRVDKRFGKLFRGKNIKYTTLSDIL